MGYGLSRAGFSKAQELFQGLRGHKDLSFGVIGELPVIVGKRKVGQTLTLDGKEHG
jgi:hypothetical protein